MIGDGSVTSMERWPCRLSLKCWASATISLMWISGPEFLTGTFGDYQAQASTQLNRCMRCCFKGPSTSIHASAFGKLGHLTNAASSCGSSPTIAAGQLIGWQGVIPRARINVHCVTKRMRQFTTCWPRACLRTNFGLTSCSVLGSQESPRSSLKHLLMAGEAGWLTWLIALWEKGSTLLILGAWTLWRHRNNCAFNGVPPRVSTAMSMVRDEAWAWCMAGAKGLSLLVDGDLATAS
jgi:hypothetical protein